MTLPVVDIDALLPRIHTTPDLLSRSCGRVSARFDTPMAAVNALLQMLQPLPAPLLQHWLREMGGHIIINSRQHAYTGGSLPWHGQSLPQVAQINIAFSISDPVYYLTPIGHLICEHLAWNRPQSCLKDPDTFARTVRRCFDAGYGLRPAARQDATTYLATGIAAYLVDRRQFNIHDPALEKLLHATVFSRRGYRTVPCNT